MKSPKHRSHEILLFYHLCNLVFQTLLIIEAYPPSALVPIWSFHCIFGNKSQTHFTDLVVGQESRLTGVLTFRRTCPFGLRSAEAVIIRIFKGERSSVRRHSKGSFFQVEILPLSSTGLRMARSNLSHLL